MEGAALEAQSAHHPPVGVLRAAVWNTEEPPGGDGRHAGEPRLLRTQGDIALFVCGTHEEEIMKEAFTIRGLHDELTAAGFSAENYINFSSDFFQNKSHFF